MKRTAYWVLVGGLLVGIYIVFTRERTYETTVCILLAIGFLCSAFFTLTWTPAAIRAKRLGILKSTFWGLVDMIGLPLLVMTATGFTGWNIIQVGFVPDQPWTFTASRLCTFGALAALAAIRAGRWIARWRIPEYPEPPSKAASFLP